MKSKIKSFELFEKEEKESKGEYGGKGPFELPDNHLAGIKVPKGGSSCANCKWLSEDSEHCMNQYWIKWNGGDAKLPYPSDEYCSDWWEPKEKISKEK